MHIIPVIDLKGGRAVHARQGDRANYQPLESPLCDSADPVDVVTGLIGLYPFRYLYVADIDAILGNGRNEDDLRSIRQRFPDLGLLVDNGLSSSLDCRIWLGKGLGRLVVGSESQSDQSVLEALHVEASQGRLILSLDFQGETFLGASTIFDQSDLWPQDIIVMTLARVGGGTGPDFERLEAVQALAGSRRIYAAGGVRGADDLKRLQDLGVAGVLLATALHDRRITVADIEAVQTD